jgi:hypothetical protein
VPRHFGLVLLLVAGIAGCGGGHASPRTNSTTTPSRGAPALATRPAAQDEIVVRGESSPRTDGPYMFDGRYLVRFEQWAPEDPKLDFSSQTPFSAALQRRDGDPRGATKLFQSAARTGRRSIAIHGRYFVDISFGDFPYVVRFTPRAR